MFDLFRIRPFRPILMASERVEGGPSPNRTAEETHGRRAACWTRPRPGLRASATKGPSSIPASLRSGATARASWACFGLAGPYQGRSRARGGASVRRLEQFHGHAALQAGRRLAGQRPARERLPDPGRAQRAGHDHRLDVPKVRDPAGTATRP